MEENDWLDIKKRIIDKSKELNIDKIGFTTAEPFNELEEILIEHRESGYSSGFEEADIKFRIHPKLSLPQAQSIISTALAYPTTEPLDVESDTNSRGKFCRASWGTDYHIVLNQKLALLEEFIKKIVPAAQTLVMVDTGPLSERAVAKRAGLGWIGKNGCLITPEYGSFVFLGEILTSLPLPPDQPLENLCGQCEKCLNACPMGAIVIDRMFIDCRKCLAYQTLNKGFLTQEIKETIGEQGYIYGCDICQIGCPHNVNIINNWHDDFAPQYPLTNPCLTTLLNMSNKEFKKTFGHMSGSWRGKKPLQRNSILILGKSRNKDHIPLLRELLLLDPRPVIRSAAAWALGQFQLRETNDLLKHALELEENEDVRKVIQNILVKNT